MNIPLPGPSEDSRRPQSSTVRPSWTFVGFTAIRAVVCCVIAWGCAGQSCTPTVDLPETPAKPVLAVGLSPRSCDQAGFLDAFAKASIVSSVGVVQVPFAWDRFRGFTDYRSYTAAYDWMVAPVFADGKTAFEHFGLKKAFWLSITDPTHAERLNLPVEMPQADFANADLASAYVAECVWLADHFKPDYLAIGAEIDSYINASSATERSAMLNAIASARSAIQVAHPDTVVFVYFQYENVVQKNLWDLIEPFASASDVYAFSTYPSLTANRPNSGRLANSLPADYFAPITTKLGTLKPVVFAELGHPSSPTAFGSGSPQEQADLINWFFAGLPAKTMLIAWTYLYDLDMGSVYSSEANAYFGSMGLLRSTAPAAATPAWTAWLSRNAAP